MKEKIQNFCLNKWFLSIVTTSLVILFYLCINDFSIFYASNDDHGIAVTIINGDTSIYVSHFLTIVLGFLQRCFVDINMFVVAELILCFFSFLLLNYVFFNIFNKKYAFLVVLAINILFVPCTIIFFQWTQTTAFACATGFLFIYYLFEKYRGRKIKKLYLSFGVVIILFGSLFRFKAFEMTVLMFLLFVFCNILIDYIKQRKTEEFKTLAKSIFNKYKKLSLITLVVLVLVFSFNFVSNQIKMTNDSYLEYKAFNKYRASCLDYSTATYAGNEEFYNSIDIYSQNDIDTLKSWLGDEKFFTAEKMKEISEYSFDIFGSSFIHSALVKGFKLIYPLVPSGVEGELKNVIVFNLLWILIFAIAFFVVFFVSGRKPKIYIPTLLMLVMIYYQILFFKTHYISLVICGMALISILFYNRYQFLIVSFMSAAIMGLSVYSYFTRVNFRSTFTYAFPIIIFLLYSLSKNIRVGAMENFKKSNIMKKVVPICFVLCFVVTTMFFYKSNVVRIKSSVPNNNEKSISAFMENNKDNLYMNNSFVKGRLSINYDKPLLAPKTYDNVLAGGWHVGEDSYRRALKERNIDNIYKEMIDNENIYFLYHKDANIINLKCLEQYLNDHYGQKGQTIEFVLKDKLDDINIYSAVTVK